MGWKKTIGRQHSPPNTLYRHVRQDTVKVILEAKVRESYLQKPAQTFNLHPVLEMLREALTGRGRWILSSNMNADLIVGTSLPTVDLL